MQKHLKRGVRAAAVAAVVVGQPGLSGSARATPYSAKAVGNGTFRPAGPRSGASGSTLFNVEGNAAAANASFGTLDYLGSAFNFGGAVAAINGPITLSLAESNAAFTAPGSLNFYLTRDTTTAVTPGGTSPNFLPGSLPDGTGTQFDPKVLIGTGTFDTTGNVNPGKVDTYSLSLAPAEQSYLVGLLNTGDKFRLLVAPRDNAVAAT